MIEYDGRSWLAILVRVRGSVVPRLLPRMVLAAGFGIGAVLLLRHHAFKIPTLAHTLVGVALGLLLVFRTNASYDRYWEGRRLIGAMVNRTRDIARQIAVYIDGAETRARLTRLVRAFYWLSAQTLRKHDNLDELAEILDEDQRARLKPIAHRAPVVLGWITEILRAEAAAGRLSEQRLQMFDGNLTGFNDYLGGAERILRTPIPFAYAQHIKIFVVLFCFSAPFALADQMGWATPAVAALLALALFGIDEIGVEIEDPFGDDPNDLPIDSIGKRIDVAIGEIASVGAAPTSNT